MLLKMIDLSLSSAQTDMCVRRWTDMGMYAPSTVEAFAKVSAGAPKPKSDAKGVGIGVDVVADAVEQALTRDYEMRFAALNGTLTLKQLKRDTSAPCRDLKSRASPSEGPRSVDAC